MKWKPLGRIFELPPSPTRSTTHAQVPTVLVKQNVVRVFFAARNKAGKSYIAYLDLDRKDLTRVVHVHDEPLLALGKPGTFDDEGMMPASIIETQNEIWMYYSGWNQRGIVPYHNATGLLLSTDDGDTFARKFEGPVLERTPEEPYLAVTPCVLNINGEYKAWYISGLRWEKIGEKFEPVYVIKYASSKDGIHWNRPNIQCIPQTYPQEAFSHPSVIHHNGHYHMWYCFRDSKDFRDGKGSYRIGYGTSKDGISWQRKDAEAGIAPSQDWESTMQCYPYVTSIDGKTYMFYNGNGFGQSGIGLAVLEGV